MLSQGGFQWIGSHRIPSRYKTLLVIALLTCLAQELFPSILKGARTSGNLHLLCPSASMTPARLNLNPVLDNEFNDQHLHGQTVSRPMLEVGGALLLLVLIASPAGHLHLYSPRRCRRPTGCRESCRALERFGLNSELSHQRRTSRKMANLPSDLPRSFPSL